MTEGSGLINNADSLLTPQFANETSRLINDVAPVSQDKDGYLYYSYHFKVDIDVSQLIGDLLGAILRGKPSGECYMTAY